MTTLKKLKELFPYATLETWHQHPNGGGWVENTTYINENAQVHENALVYQNACVLENAIVSDYARVYGDAQVCEDAKVYESSQVFGDAQIYENAQVYGSALIRGNTRLAGDVQVYGNVDIQGDTDLYGGYWQVRPFYLCGTKDIVQICAPGILAIGCEKYNIATWLESYRTIGRDNEYTEEEIDRYYQYILLVADLYNNLDESVVGETNE